MQTTEPIIKKFKSLKSFMSKQKKIRDQEKHAMISLRDNPPLRKTLKLK